MDRLILMRHGKAERAAPGGEDFDRPLALRGQTDAALVARELAAQGLSPDLALVSEAQRTRHTWEAMARTLSGAAVEDRRDLYLASAREIWTAVKEADGTVMVVGHNPGLHELALRLLADASASPSQGARLMGGFPTATAAIFTFDADGRPTYDGLILARDLGGGGHD